MIPVIASNISFRIRKPRSQTTSRDEARDRLKETVQAYEEGKRLLSIWFQKQSYIIGYMGAKTRPYMALQNKD